MKICDVKLTGSIPELVRGVLEQGDLRTEVSWLKNRLESENCPVMFCHNDMQEGNILLSRDVDLETSEDPDIVIIGKSFDLKI